MPAATIAAPTSSSLRMGGSLAGSGVETECLPGPYPSGARPRTLVFGMRRPRGSAVAAGGVRELARSGPGGGLVLLAHGVPDLLAVDRDRARGLDADADRVPDDLHHVDDDVVAEHDLLAGAAGDDEHEDSSLESFEDGSTRRHEGAA